MNTAFAIHRLAKTGGAGMGFHITSSTKMATSQVPRKRNERYIRTSPHRGVHANEVKPGRKSMRRELINTRKLTRTSKTMKKKKKG